MKKITFNPLRMVSMSAGLVALSGLSVVFGEEAAAAATASTVDAGVLQWLALSSALGLGIAAVGCGLGQGKMVASAMDGISRNPKAASDMFVPMILGLAFIEALTLFNLIFVFIFKAALLG